MTKTGRNPTGAWPQRGAERLISWAGWRLDAGQPLPSQCVIIGAPHTSGSDLLVALLARAALGIDFCWAAKDTYFWGPVGWVFRAWGGIPVNRRERTNFVARMAVLFRENEVFRLVIAPEGTRRRAAYWRTGFYYIAQAAQVPIVLGYADYSRKVVGFGPTLVHTGDIEADFAFIRSFYATVMGRYPDRHSEIAIRRRTGRSLESG